jgi:hypothetical protein
VARVFKKVVRRVTTVTWTVSWMEEDGGPGPQNEVPAQRALPQPGDKSEPAGEGDTPPDESLTQWLP